MCPRMTLKNRVGGRIGVSCAVCDVGSLRISVTSAIDVSKVEGRRTGKVSYDLSCIAPVICLGMTHALAPCLALVSGLERDIKGRRIAALRPVAPPEMAQEREEGRLVT